MVLRQNPQKDYGSTEYISKSTQKSLQVLKCQQFATNAN